jgi:hypothetical protein
MENKKLVKILIKDMAELEELIAEMKSSHRFDILEMEFIHTRAKGVLQLLQMLEQKEEPALKKAEEPAAIVEKLKEKVEEAVQAVVLTAGLQQEQIIHEVLLAEEPEEKAEVKLEVPVNPEPVYETQPEPVQVQAEVKDQVQAEVKDQARAEGKDQERAEVKEIADGEVLLENNHHAEPGSRLGESFLKGKSLNDMITDQVKLEFKLSNRPVSSIQSSIGINDRFQYIRELFDGDNKKYTEAVKTLDSMHNVKEAVEYLRSNYRWKKNETSLKFVNLVKRRFQDPVNG